MDPFAASACATQKAIEATFWNLPTKDNDLKLTCGPCRGAGGQGGPPLLQRHPVSNRLAGSFFKEEGTELHSHCTCP